MTDPAAFRIQLEAEPDGPLRDLILAPLLAYNEEMAGPSRRDLLAITVRDASDAVVGGLYARMSYGYMFIELLALGPARGAGRGTALMAMAEAECRRRGLLGIWLDTWTFQAPGFYEKLGFAECGRIPDYPPGHDRIFYVKRLGEPPPR